MLVFHSRDDDNSAWKYYHADFWRLLKHALDISWHHLAASLRIGIMIASHCRYQICERDDIGDDIAGIAAAIEILWHINSAGRRAAVPSANISMYVDMIRIDITMLSPA